MNHNRVNASDSAMDIDGPQIDESLYSRQLYVMGHDAQLRMGTANVLIIGLDGVGVEIAKNIILAGVKSVTLHDDTLASYLDLAAQFYLTESDVGHPRAAQSLSKLADLNPYVQVHGHSGEITESFLLGFRVVVLVNTTNEQALRINKICHDHSIGFISTQACGVFGSVFCDFGNTFVVSDRDGEKAMTCMIASISNTNPPLVTVNDDTRHQLETGDYVTFREIEGMPFLNACTPRKITVLGPFTFTLDVENEEDGQRFVQSASCSGGYMIQVKQPLTMTFKPLEEALAHPGEFLVSDFGKFDRPPLLHVAFQALDMFKKKHGKYPAPGSLTEATQVYAYALELNKQRVAASSFYAENLENDESKKIVIALASGASGVLSPMAAFLGGIVGQEALKACSGKFTPINQFFYFDAVECLPPIVYDGSTTEFTPLGSRYDGQIVVLGRTLQDKIQHLSMFLVGAGAIGCEMLKNWAMMGVSCAKDSVIHITDMDTIEKSNLNRQFLFRAKDVTQPKSTVAGLAIKEMNPHVNVVSYVSRVGEETEAQFNDDFFESLSGVCTALDNVEARLYMDQRCLFYGLPMLESGTLGTKGNTQIVVPHKTENYGASRDPPEKGIPLCTLKHYPNAIEHTLQWARDWFEGEFFQAPSDVNQYITADDFIKQLNAQQNTKVEILERLKLCLVTSRPSTFEECVVWARLKFEELFNNQIQQLLYNNPLNQITSSGVPFWSGPKRPPTPLVFDVNSPVHLDFILAVANMRARIYGLQEHSDRSNVVQMLKSIRVPNFVPRDGVKIPTSDAEMKDDTIPLSSNDQADQLLSELPLPESLTGYQMIPVEFDKDNDSHMEVIVATSNLRARNYKIPEADMHRSRFIAGKIIPAIATTTALVTGLVCFEFYKVFQNKPVDHYKNGFVNLALPLFTFSEPIAPATTTTTLKGKEYKWTVWDRLDLDTGDITLQQFLDYFSKTYEGEISMLSYGATILYAMYSQKSRSKERMNMKISELVETVTKRKIDPSLKYLILEVCATDAQDEDMELPYLRFRLHQ